MNTSLAYILLTTILLQWLMPVERAQSFITQGQQFDCVHQVVRDAEIVTDRQLDVNQDGILDKIIIYGDGELYLLVATNQPTVGCQVILNDSLTSRQMYAGERQPMTVKQVELVDVTGDGRPELHIGLEGTYFFRESGAFHAIYMLHGEHMNRIFVSDQCLPMSSFEFRTKPDGTRLIYLDQDQRCVFPSSSRDYEIYQWNTTTSQFERAESGEINKWTPDPLWSNAVTFTLMIVVMSVLIFGGVWVYRQKRTKRL